jgi:hypothetical protein
VKKIVFAKAQIKSDSGLHCDELVADVSDVLRCGIDPRMTLAIRCRIAKSPTGTGIWKTLPGATAMPEGNAPTESDFWPNNLVGFSRHLANHS